MRARGFCRQEKSPITGVGDVTNWGGAVQIYFKDIAAPASLWNYDNETLADANAIAPASASSAALPSSTSTSAATNPGLILSFFAALAAMLSIVGR
jgi:hypothetical protein